MKKFSSFLFITILIVAFALPSKTDANIQLFTDVPTSHANYADVKYLSDHLVIEPSGRFGPNDIVTREEVVVMVAKALNLNGAPRQTQFSDVLATNSNAGFIQSAVDAGIVSGVTATTFGPNAKLTRGQMAALLARAFKLPKGTTTCKDVPSNHFAYAAVQQLAAAKIAAGYPDGTFKPNEKLTRIQCAAFLARALRYANDTK